MKREEVRGRRFSVIGGARSGIAVAELLHRNGGRVLISDAGDGGKNRQPVDPGIMSEYGGHTSLVFEADVVVLSPGVPSDAPVVREALTRGRPVVSEVEVASWFCDAPVVAVTGTNGKTTTTTLLGRMFSDARRPAAVGGNIGVAFSQVVESLTPDSTALLEISSFQLDHSESFRPRVSVLLNITPDHLDRYDHSFEQYIDAKCRVFARQREGDTIVYNHDDPVTRENVQRRLPPAVHQLPFSTTPVTEEGAWVVNGMMRSVVRGSSMDIIPTADISIRGQHNLYNAMAATLAARAMGVSAASLRATLRNFKGVEHRLEFVRELNGITYINDSKATNVDAVWYALQSYTAPLVVLIGGRDKGNDYAPLRDPVRDHARAVIAIGESAGKVVAAFGDVTHVEQAASMEEAVTRATACAHQGDIVLLSPACASFDWFENYEHRGRVFKEIVMQR